MKTKKIKLTKTELMALKFIEDYGGAVREEVIEEFLQGKRCLNCGKKKEKRNNKWLGNPVISDWCGYCSENA